MALLDDLTFLRILAALTIVALGMTTGCTIGMYSFSIPVIRVKESHQSLVMTRLFNELVSRGFRFLQATGRVEALGLLALTLVLARHPNPDVARRWKYFASALLVGTQAIWYEVYFIFLTDDRMSEIQKTLENAKKKG